MICPKCNATIPDKAVFCPSCGGRVAAPAPVIQQPEDRTVRVRRAAPETVVSTPVVETDRTTQVRPGNSGFQTYIPEEDGWHEPPITMVDKPRYIINFISLLLLVGCLALWVLMPFMAVNTATMGDQPTALALILDDVDYLGDLTEALAYWMSIAAAGGLVLCLACVLLKSRIVTRILAVIAAAPFVFSIVSVAQWAEDFGEFFEFFGIAFWGILAVLLVVAVLGGGWRKRK